MGPPVAGVVPAGHLRRTLEQVPDGHPRGEAVPVVGGPAELVDEGREEQRGVGHATRDHDVGAAIEGLDDRGRPQVRGGEHRVMAELQRIGMGTQVVADDGRDAQAARALPPAARRRPPGRRRSG